jgi:predicted Ser/Thr protein kinase
LPDQPRGTSVGNVGSVGKAGENANHEERPETMSLNGCQGIKDRFISKLLKAGKLKTKYEDPTNPNQAYTTVDQSSQRSAIGDQQRDEA